MRKENCRRAAAFASALARILRDDRARREWLWLRAREKEDDESLRCLERADRDLPSRMAACDAEVGAIDDPRARKEAYGRLLDERLPRFNDVDCGCRECARKPAGAGATGGS
jgi:hypothetical protein